MALRGGLIGGLTGGVGMALLMLLAFWWSGQDPYVAMKSAGAWLLGERAMLPGYDGPAIALGLASHLMVSVGWGLLFAVIFFGYSRATTIAAGAFWGITVWLAMYYALLPALGLEIMVVTTPQFFAVMLHLLFGIGVAVGFLPYQVHLVRSVRSTYGTGYAPVY